MRKSKTSYLVEDATEAGKIIKDEITKRKNNPELSSLTLRHPATKGLEIRISTNSATWYFMYNIKIGEKWARRRVQIGSFESYTVGEARKAANALRVQIDSGKDPVQEKKDLALERQRKLDEAVSIAELFNKWISSPKMLSRKSGVEEPTRMLQKDVLPKLGKLDIKDVHGRHLLALQTAMRVRGARVTNITLSLVRQMFGYAVDTFLLEELPKFPAKLEENEPCDRVLTVSEIVELFQKIPHANLVNTTELALKIQLATACRIGELIKAEWKHICLDAGEWTIPAENSKTGRPLTVYLSSYALKQFKQLHELSGYLKWILPNHTETDHQNTKNISKQARDRQRQTQIAGRSSTTDALILKGGTWTPHDLRRTAASTMQALRVNPFIIERCLNHSVEKMTRTYVPQDPELEMYQAWQSLGEVLEVCDSDKGNQLADLEANNRKQSISTRKSLPELMRLINSNVIELRKHA